MTERGEYKLVKQISGMGFYAVVGVSATPATGKPRLIFPEHGLEYELRHWHKGIQLGVAMFREKYPELTYDIHITDMKGHEVDTTDVGIAIATLHALCHMLNLKCSLADKFEEVIGSENR